MIKTLGALLACMFLTAVVASADPVAGNGSYGVQSVSAGSGVTITGTPQNPIINSTGGGGTGTVTSVTGTGNISTTNSTTTPVVQITNSPTFTGQTMLGIAGTASDSGTGNGQLNIGNSTGVGPQQSLFGTFSNANNAVSGVQGNVFGIYDYNGSSDQLAIDTSGDLGIFGYLSVNNLTPGRCLTSATNPSFGGSSNAGERIVSTTSPCGTGTVTNVTGTGNISVATGTTTPVVTITSAPTFAGRVTSNDPTVAFYSGVNNMKRTYVSQNTVSSSGNSDLGPDPSSTVAGVAGSVWSFSEYDGNNLITNLAALDASGNYGAASLNAANLTTGNCLTATGAKVTSTSQGCITTALNGAVQTGTQAPHIEQFNNTPTVANGAARMYTFATAFATPPVCQAGQSAAGGGLAPAGLFLTAVTTTTVTVNNGTGATQTPYVSCIGL